MLTFLVTDSYEKDSYFNEMVFNPIRSYTLLFKAVMSAAMAWAAEHWRTSGLNHHNMQNIYTISLNTWMSIVRLTGTNSIEQVMFR